MGSSLPVCSCCTSGGSITGPEILGRILATAFYGNWWKVGNLNMLNVIQFTNIHSTIDIYKDISLLNFIYSFKVSLITDNIYSNIFFFTSLILQKKIFIFLI